MISVSKIFWDISDLSLTSDDGWEDMSSSESSCDDVADDVSSDVTEEPMEASNGEVMVICAGWLTKT